MADELLGSIDDQISFRFRAGDVNVNSFERMTCNKKPRRYSSNSRILDYQPSVSYRKSKTSESSRVTYKSDGTSIHQCSNYERPVNEEEHVSRKVSEPLNEFGDNFNNSHNSRHSFISTESFDSSPSGTPEYLRGQQSRGSADGNSKVEKSPSSSKSNDKQIPHIELPEKASNEMLGHGSVPRVLLRVASCSKRGKKIKNRKSIDSLLRTSENIEEQKILENDPNNAFNMTPMYHSDGEDDDISDIVRHQ